jgi:hypothetical protein
MEEAKQGKPVTRHDRRPERGRLDAQKATKDYTFSRPCLSLSLSLWGSPEESDSSEHDTARRLRLFLKKKMCSQILMITDSNYNIVMAKWTEGTHLAGHHKSNRAH